MGDMEVREVHYLAIPSTASSGPASTSTNYYRIRVNANSKLGVADYRSGWFPKRAVDNLFGEVSRDGGIEALKTQKTLEKRLDKALIKTQDNYLDAIEDPDVDPAYVQRLLQARKRALSYPALDAQLPESGSIQIEYNPELGLVLNHANEKLVFVFASNPDDVIGAIANFAESDETSLAVLKLADVIAAQAATEVAETEARNAASAKFDQLIVTQINTVISEIEKAQDKNLDDKERAQKQAQVIGGTASLVELLSTLD